MSVGTVNSVAAVVSDGVEKGIRICRTQAIPHGAIGGLPSLAEIQDSAAETDAEPIARQYILSDAEIVAAMTGYLIKTVDSEADTVLACPAIYSVDELSVLRAALDAEGLARIALTPEPIAAAAWLEMQGMPEESTEILVYDLGGGGLDITLLRIDPEDGARIVGRPVRSSAFGGRAFSALLANYAHDLTADTTSPGLPGDLPDAAVAGLRAEFIRSSLPLLHECIRSAGRTSADIDRVLLVGGAARPAEVARVLADELGCPVVTAPDPAHCIAIGAAALAARGVGGAELLVPPPRTGHPARSVAALAGAAAVLAAVGVVAMSSTNPADSGGPQALDVRKVVPLSPFVAGHDGRHEDRPGSTQPHTARWISTDYLVGYRNSALDAATAGPPDAPIRPPHSMPNPRATAVESSGAPPMPVWLNTSGSGGSRPGTGEAAELPADLAIPTVGSFPPPEVPTAFDLETVSATDTSIASTANVPSRSRVSAVGESVHTSSAAGAGARSRSAPSTSSRSGASTVGGTETDSHTGASSRTGDGAGTDSTASTGGASSSSGGNAGSHSGASASRQPGGRTGSDSGTHAGSGSAGTTGS
ncbi:Hsp70 family protein [Nocardia pneumoniae]|uniref:Hsp70 family protein n=1 Tax=Nocardia pneumoniae TaxID=228601 RepID=UPI0014617003|nr:Hsp70 family protein [Nocardia pneumoniae]